MAMMSFEQAWRKFATPAERAVATATRSIKPATARLVIERARRAGYLVRTKR